MPPSQGASSSRGAPQTPTSTALSLLTENGDPVWTSETGDTTVALPDSVRLQASQAYFWRVEAIGNGIAATTGVHRLQIPRE
jgi:hypothetical protein